MKKLNTVLFAAAALALMTSAPVSAQGSDGWWRPAVLGTAQDGDRPTIGDVVRGRRSESDTRSSPWPTTGRDDGRYRTDDRYGDVYGRQGNAKKGKGNGSVHCRNGQGHPVHGRQWCANKGWNRVGWGDVIFRGPAPDRDRRLGSGGIAGVLGDIVFGRLNGYGRDAGLSGPLDGRWLPLSQGGAVMQLRMGGVPLAELADLNMDGRADVILLNGR